MASPQLENGHIRIANELFEAILRFPFSKREQSIVFAIIRLTYGYGKKHDTMTHYQIAKTCGLRRDSVAKTIPHLISINVITVHGVCTIIRGQKVDSIGINKDFDAWTTVHKTRPDTNHDRTQIMYGDRTQIMETTVHKSPHSINNISKDNKDNNKRAHTWTLPDCINSRAWAEFEQHRKDMRKPLTDMARTKAANFLSQWESSVQQEIVDASIRCRWAGLFPPKQSTNGNGINKSAATRFMENLKNA